MLCAFPYRMYKRLVTSTLSGRTPGRSFFKFCLIPFPVNKTSQDLFTGTGVVIYVTGKLLVELWWSCFHSASAHYYEKSAAATIPRNKLTNPTINSMLLNPFQHTSQKKDSSDTETEEKKNSGRATGDWIQGLLVRTLIRETRGPGFHPQLYCLNLSSPPFHIQCFVSFDRCARIILPSQD